ncbi:hypothetical protein MMC07_004927 [Pseudocyphellaria aurata]|nr:hypothetical protein [Pseudocyphellaria aurata]
MLANLLLLGLLAFLAQGELTYPKLTLPWGTWQATNYNKEADFFTFSNVRFGRATNGSMRFKAPAYPAHIDNPLAVQDSTYGPICPQTNSTRPCVPDGDGTIGGPIVAPLPDSRESEDCLFLDIYVPRSALEPGSPQLPVVVWFYGGGYLYGAKSIAEIKAFFYNGTGTLQAAAAAGQSKAIFIAGNYRVGAFGWLAGSQMERDATPNAGLYDQRLLLRWVQDYVHLIGGDKSRVSAWGESVGAGSILHHLISRDGKQDPLFSKAILQSPAFQLQWDRAGSMDATYKSFAELAHCPDHSIKCLQQANTSTLIKANQRLFERTLPCTGLFPVGPALDGNLIKQLPAVAFDSGNYWKHLDSIIVSHVHDEAGPFVPEFIQTQTDVEKYVTAFFPQSRLSELKTAVLKQYPAREICLIPKNCAKKRTSNIIRDMSFTCNTRLLYDAYHKGAKTYMMQYDVLHNSGLAVHGSDLLALFRSTEFDIIAYLTDKFGKVVGHTLGGALNKLAPLYQSYFASHAIHGDPNTGRRSETSYWNQASNDSNFIEKVMQVHVGTPNIFNPIFNPDFQDVINTNQACDFWKEAAWNITQQFPDVSHSLETDESQAVLHADLK